MCARGAHEASGRPFTSPLAATLECVRMSTFWRVTYHLAVVAAVSGSILQLAATLLWLGKRRSRAAVVSTCGASLIAAAQYLHHPLPLWRPAVHSHVLFFIYSYGLEFGGLLVALGLVWHFAGFERAS